MSSYVYDAHTNTTYVSPSLQVDKNEEALGVTHVPSLLRTDEYVFTLYCRESQRNKTCRRSSTKLYAMVPSVRGIHNRVHLPDPHDIYVAQD